MSNKPFYHGTIKNIINAFGGLFSNIKIERKVGDSVKGETQQIIKVPISYAPKEKWYYALTSDPTRDNQVAYTFPRMSFEIIGYTYDTTRKLTRGVTISCTDEDGVEYIETPAPWNLDIALYIASNKTEDVLQIIEQILPTFNPDYTLNIKTVDDLDLVTPVPISLTSIAHQDDYQGDYTSHRLIMYTLSFTVKTYIYGQVLHLPMITEIVDVFRGDVESGEITDISSESADKNKEKGITLINTTSDETEVEVAPDLVVFENE